MGMEYSEIGVTNKAVAVTFKCQGRNWFDEDEEQAVACMRILDTVTNRRELVEILYRMKSPEGKLGDTPAFMSSYWKLFNELLFQSQQKHRAFALLERLNWEPCSTAYLKSAH